jgi:hypothetical protein
MIYLKSALVGALVVVAAAVATALTMIVLLMIKSRNLPAGQAIAWDPISFYRGSVVTWVCLFGAFLVGFAWQYRRMLRAH